MASMEEIIEVIEELFVIFNFAFFQGSLISPVLTVQSNTRRSPSVMGWCTAHKAWKETETQEEFYEIAICPEFFDLGLEEICDTLLHECVHLYHLQAGIQDVSRGGHYHNSTFAKKALECGMLVEKSPKSGWSQTTLTNQTREFISSLTVDREAFKLMRKREFDLSGLLGGLLGGTGAPSGQNGGKTPGRARQSYRKYVCPKCKMTVRATKDVNVKCGDCEETMEKEGSTKEGKEEKDFLSALVEILNI